MKRVITLFFLATMFFAGNRLLGSSQMGGWITFESLDSTTLKITVHQLRDCNGIASVPKQVNIVYQNVHIRLPLNYSSSRDISPIPASCGTSKCSGSSSLYGLQEITYTATWQLDTVTACSIEVWAGDCCYHNALTNGLADRTIRIRGSLNLCKNRKYTPLYLASEPLTFIRASTGIQHGYHFTDSLNGYDSIAWTISNPQDSTGISLYSGHPLYTHNRPFGYLGFPNQNLPFPAGYSITPEGTLQFQLVNQSTVALVSVNARHFKRINGVMEPVMDQEVNSVFFSPPATSQNQWPTLQGPTIRTVCLTKTSSCIEIRAVDADTSDTLDYQAVHRVPGLQITRAVTSPNEVKLVLCFNPDSIGPGRKCDLIFIRVRDRACPVYGYKSIIYQVHYKDAPEESSFPDVLSKERCGGFVLDMQKPVGAPAGINYSVSRNSQSFSGGVYHFFQEQDTGWKKFTIRMSGGNGCFLDKPDSFYLNRIISLTAQILDTVDIYCSDQPSYLRSQVQSVDNAISYGWSTGSKADTAFLIPKSGVPVILTVQDTFGCLSRDTLFQQINDTLKIIQEDKRLCLNGASGLIFLQPTVQGGRLPYTYSWFDGFNGSTRIYTPPVQNTKGWVTVYDSAGCQASDSFQITRYQAVEPVAPPDMAYCKPEQVNLKLQNPLGDVNRYRWVHGNSSAFGTDFNTLVQQTSLIHVYYTDAEGCETMDTVRITIHPYLEADAGQDTALCDGTRFERVFQRFGGKQPFDYYVDGFQQNDTRFEASPSQNGYVYFTVIDANNCQANDSIYITVNPTPYIRFSSGPQVCQSALSRFQLDTLVLPAGGVWSGQGHSTNGLYNFFNPHQLPDGWYPLQYTFISDKGCMAVDTLNVRVYEIPNARFAPDKNPVNQMEEVEFIPVWNPQGTQARFFWDLGDGTTSDSLQPKHRYVRAGLYDVSLKVINGVCSDSVYKARVIRVDSVMSVSVPMGKSMEDIQVYPVPFRSGLHIVAPEGTPLVAARVTDIRGSLILEERFEATSRLHLKFPESLTAGVYLLLLWDESGKLYVKEIMK